MAGRTYSKVLLVSWLVLWSLHGGVSFADEPPTAGGEGAIATFQDKTVAEWIAQLQNGRDSKSRAKAAQALGYLARKTGWTPDGFSDIPFETPEPSQLKDDEIRSIVSALVGGLKDRSSEVRESSALAVSWIGERARDTVPALIPLLDDQDQDTVHKAIRAVDSIGPAAKDAVPALLPQLKNADLYTRRLAAAALHSVGADPQQYLPTLIHLLGNSDDFGGGPAHYAAMELGEIGDIAVPALLAALEDADPIRRKFAAYTLGNMAGWEKLTKRRRDVAIALCSLTEDENREAVQAAVQALGSIREAPEKSIPILTSFLTNEDPIMVFCAAGSLGEYGPEARPSIPKLIAVLSDGHVEYPGAVVNAIRYIGVDRESARAISRLTFAEHGDSATGLLGPLFPYPDAAVKFLANNPRAADVGVADQKDLFGIMRSTDGRYKPLRDALYKSKHLPLAVIATLGDPQFLPMLNERIKKADPHTKTRLRACARACGQVGTCIVKISESQPGDFKPASAWPETDARRISPQFAGHGDGYTEVILTGRVLAEGGQPAVAPKFFRTNDTMLLGQRVRDELPIEYNQETGRFVLATSVFAAYCMGKGQPEPGPYQTGSCLALIEAEGCKPLAVRFYDEMPDVEITLSAEDPP